MINNISKKGKLSDGVYIQETNSFLTIAMKYATETSINLDATRMDNRIILCALELKNQGRNVFFVSKDINARVKALALGLAAVDYEKQKVNIDSLYTGFDEIEIEPYQTAKLKKEGQMLSSQEFVPNQFVKVNAAGQKDFVLTQWNHSQKKLLKVTPLPHSICGISALNIRQQLAFQLLLDPSIPLVTLVGKAGTGKTLLAIAAALEQTVGQHLYTKILVSRPVLPLGKDIGFLPGDKEEKMSNWMQPLFDNLDFLISQARNQAIQSISQLIKAKTIEIEALSLIRGRSLPKQFIIIDEAQNLSPHEIKTVVSRAGKETKMVFSGDPYQIDNPYLDSSSNGLSYLVDTLKGQLLF